MQIKALLKHPEGPQWKHLLLVLIVFALCRILSIGVFYEGFLKNFSWLNDHLFGAGHAPAFLSRVPYHSASLFLGALCNPLFAGLLLAFYLPFIIKRKNIKRISAYDQKSDRYLVFIPALLLAWELSTYDYNYYLDRAFYFDRIGLLLLALLLWRYPLLTPLYIALAFVYRSQFNYQVEGFTLPDKRFLFDMMIMYMVVLYVRLSVPDFKIPFLFFAAVIIASNYFMSGAFKLLSSPHLIDWPLFNDPGDLFLNVHYRGWLARAGEQTIQGMHHFLTTWGRWLQLLVLLLEIGSLFVLRNRRTAMFLFASLGSMHIGIFIFGSMLFWKLIIVDLILFLAFLDKRSEIIFKGNIFPVSMLVILGSGLWLSPLHIAWHDTPFNQYFTYEVVDATGQTREIEKNEMNPYHQWFQYDKFLFLVDRPTLTVSGFGYTGAYRLSRKIKKAGVENFSLLEENEGRNRFDTQQKKEFDSFIRTYFSNRNRRLNESFFPKMLSAPHHLYNWSAGDAYHNQSPVRLFRVIFNQVYSVGGKPQQISRETVDEVSIPL